MTERAGIEGEPKPEDDRAILQAIANGEARALGRLYDRHAASVFGLCLRILKERTVAEETLEDIFWEIWKRADRYDPTRGNPLAYLMNLAQSRAIDRLRARARRQRLRPTTDSADFETGPALRLADHNTPLGESLENEQRRRIKQSLLRLSPEQRAVVELAYFDGLTHVEIAAKLDQPLGTVKTRIRQGLVHLRESLRAEFGDTNLRAGVRPAVDTDFHSNGQRDLA